MRILLQPAAGKEARGHFEDTITTPPLLDYYANKINPEDFLKLKNLNEKHIKVWGIVPSVDDKPRKQWTDLLGGDWVVFYANKKYIYVAQVYFKIHNNKLAHELWGTDKTGRTWEYIYFIKEGKQIDLVHNPELLGFSKDYYVMGANLLDEEKSQKLKKYIDLNEGGVTDLDAIEPTNQEEVDFNIKVRKPKTSEEAEEEIKKISNEFVNKSVTEKVIIAKILLRSPRFARLVKEQAKYICEICGEKPFIQKNGLPYAEAHHKFELSKSRIDNPKDMICVCPICHRVLHFGNNEALKYRGNLK